MINMNKLDTCGTTLADLYGSLKYLDNISVGKKYWFFFPDNSSIYKTIPNDGKPLKIRITFIRSNYYFYDFPDCPELPEDAFPGGSFMARQLIVAELDPERDLRPQWGKLLDTWHPKFDDSITKVINYDNDR